MKLNKAAALAALVYSAAVLVFTVAGVILGPAGSQIGGTRPSDTIPGHVLELAAFGLLMGVLASWSSRRLTLSFALLAPIMVVALDLDHIPAYLGLAQTIRPAHSFVFLFVSAVAIVIVLKRLDYALLAVSATLGHMGVDLGIFAPLSPLNFSYVQLAPYQVPFLIGSVFAAVAVGMVRKSRANAGPMISAEPSDT